MLYQSMERMNSRSLVSYFTPATAIGQCSRTGNSSSINSKVIVKIDVSGLIGLSPTCILFERDVAHSAPLPWFGAYVGYQTESRIYFFAGGGVKT